jgi:hypothetical protein
MIEDKTGCQCCTHWHRTGLQAGECRRNPPIVGFIVANNSVAKLTAYPERKPADPTCGEFKRKLELLQ